MSEELNSTAPVAAGKESKLNDRPFRVKLRGSVLVLVRLPNKRSVRAAIHQLATLRGKAQMLFPMWATQGWMQPFRFVDLSDANRETLDKKLKSFVGEAAKSAATGA